MRIVTKRSLRALVFGVSWDGRPCGRPFFFVLFKYSQSVLEPNRRNPLGLRALNAFNVIQNSQVYGSRHDLVVDTRP